MTLARALAISACALCAGITGARAEPCRQALALGLDVSGSVDAREWRLQIEGLARALDAPPVRQAFLAMDGVPVWLAVYEWAGDSAQRDLLDWRAIRTDADLDRAMAELRAVPRRPHAPGTAMGAGMAYGGQKLAQIEGCWRYTLDISADGRSNIGPRPQNVRHWPSLAHVTINGLVVSTGSERATEAARTRELDMLESYFRGAVIQGVGSFVERARSYADYETAMTKKLLKELQTIAIGQADVPTSPLR